MRSLHGITGTVLPAIPLRPNLALVFNDLMKDAECIFVTGRRGSGKTTYVQRAVDRAPRVIVFDPLGQYAREFRWPLAGDLASLHRLAAERWRSPAPWRLALTVAGDFDTELHKLSVYLWHAMAPFERGRDRKKMLLIVEEMNLSVPVHPLPKGRRGFMRLVLQGRHRGIAIIGVSQRPALVSADFRSSAAETIIFPLGVEDQGYMGARYRGELASLTPHRFVRFADGVATRGENPPLGSSPATSRRR